MRRKHLLMRLPIEVLGRQRVDGLTGRGVVQQHRAQGRLFGVQVLRRQ